MSAWQQLSSAWKNRHKLGNANQTRELAAFLPVSLEIQEAPPNPLARWLARSLLSLITLGVVWSIVGEVNIVASAEGKIIPSSRVKHIQPLEKGVVKTILVKEGDYVEQGQALVELETTLTGADQNRLQSELHNTQLNLALNRALLRKMQAVIPSVGKSDPTTLSNLTLPLQTTALETQLYQQRFQQQWQHYWSQYQALIKSQQRNQAEQAASRAVIKKLQKTLPLVTKRATNLKNLSQKDYVSETDYLLVEQERIQNQQDLAAEQQRLRQLQAAGEEITEQINTHNAQSRSQLLAEIADQQRQQTALVEELTKATDLNNKQMLLAPVAGRVQELAISTVGGVVTEAQQLMLIVPEEEQLMVEVFLENKDIGFVEEGMPSEIKIHTFPFTKYGVVEGEVVTVSDDATVDEQRGLIYRMQVSMNKKTMLVNGKMVNLIPGMAVTAEVQTGRRRVIEFFLAPLLRGVNESMHER